MIARLTRDLPGFLRAPLTVDQAASVLRRRMETREDRFLSMAEQMIYGHNRSPYVQLLRAAGCEYGDLKALVNQEGVEEALTRLAGAGVYVTLEEFKGRKEAVRGNRRFMFAESDFDHPRLPYHYEIRSGGTRGKTTSVRVNLSFITDLAVNTTLTFQAHSLAHHAHVIWLTGGVTPMLIYARLARTPIAWFHPLKPLPFDIQAGSRFLAALGWLSRRSLPLPSFLDLMEPGRLAAWLGTLLRGGRRICVTTYASSAVRVADAANAKGIDLEGTTFVTLGEPFTAAKQRVLEAAGAQALVRYAFTEAGIIGYGCATRESPDDLHFFSDSFGLIQRRREVIDDHQAIDAFLVTSLLPSAPKVLLNVENGDHGIVTQKTCRCNLGILGLRTHVSMIRSFEKLSGEGMTFAQTDLLHILEDVLPTRFGGAATDYQAVEEEENGILRLSLIVSPRVGAVDETRLREAFIEELAKDGGFARVGALMWQRAHTVSIKRQWPVATGAGKILPFQIVRH